jgi:hypothetical protein
MFLVYALVIFAPKLNWYLRSTLPVVDGALDLQVVRQFTSCNRAGNRVTYACENQRDSWYGHRVKHGAVYNTFILLVLEPCSVNYSLYDRMFV